MRAVEHRKSAVGLAGAHRGLPDWPFYAKFHKFGLFRGTWRQTFVWLFLLNIWHFWRQLAHTIRLVFWLFKCLAEKCF